MGQVLSIENAPQCELKSAKLGTLKGISLTNPQTKHVTADRYCKVPYAAKIEGDSRFTLPQALPEGYDYTGNYADFGLKCPQPSVPHPQFRYTKSPSEEYIQYNNIWVPKSDKHKPEGGWPVLFYIHGGFLQYSTPNVDFFNIAEMLDDDEFDQKYILVAPGYRLNMFGFLSSKELLEENPKNSNFGFWDQRLALEWTYENIAEFGGNPEKITVGGVSAGSYSAFFQLTYELYHPEAQQIIKQLAFWSNLVYIQPKTIEECQEQFDEIVSKLDIDEKATGAEKLAALRKLDSEFIEDFIPSLSMHTFRAVTDGHFISPDIIKDIKTGKFAELMIAKGCPRILSGEVDHELIKYSLLNTPNTLEELPIQVENYYPRKVVPALLKAYGADKLDPSSKDFKEDLRKVYGAIISDGQVYSSARGLLSKLVEHGYPAKEIFRYRIGFRAHWLDAHIDPEINVPHGCDLSVWFYQLRAGFTEQEKNDTNAFLKPYLAFLNFDEQIDWPSHDITKLRLFSRQGTDEYIEDPDWDWGVKIANIVYNSLTE